MTPELQVPPPRSQRRAPTLTRCCIVLGIIVAVAVGGFFAVVISVGTYQHIRSVVNPHGDAHHNHKIGSVIGAVQPLFDKDVKFDVAASVWMRHSAEDLANGMPEGLVVTHGVNETVLLSKIVMHDVGMTTLNAMASVDFELPLEHFKQHNISHLDLRGAITLIPTTPSKLDRVLEFSDWRPVEAEPFPRRSHPFPLGSPSTGTEPSLHERIYELYGSSFPLIELREVETQCKITKIEAEDEEDEDDGSLKVVDDPQTPKTIKGAILHKMHPHLVTRTHAYVVNEDRPYNRTKFDKEHLHLKEHSCGQGLDSGPSYKHCFRDYTTNGHRELRLVLRPKDGSKRKEVAYGPYISKTLNGAGPRDVIPLPISRENCTDWKNGSAPETRTSMKVTWNIHFSGLTSGRLHLLENLTGGSRFPFNATALEQVNIQNRWEQNMALFGQKLTQNHRPKRRLFFTSIRHVSQVLGYFLDIAYWYTRATNAGISITGTYLQIVSVIIACFYQTVFAVKNADGSILPEIAVSIFASFWACLPTYFMAQAVSPVTLKWASWRSVSLQRSAPTHRERSSRRNDPLSRGLQAMILVFIWIIYYAAVYFNLHAVSPALPRQTDEELGKNFELLQFFSSFTSSLGLASGVFQVCLNHRSRTFAGSYRISTIITAIGQLTRVVYLLPMIVGNFAASEGLPLIALLHFAVEAALVHQAVTLPRIEQRDDEEEE